LRRSWTNVEYKDGVCYYFYSYNSYDQNMRINRNGDCSHVAIGPDGNPTPVFAGGGGETETARKSAYPLACLPCSKPLKIAAARNNMV
jgi:hypothetical protein